MKALVRLSTADDPFIGALNLIETYGLGDLTPNTVLLGSTESPERFAAYCHLLQQVHIARRNIIIFHENPERAFGRKKRIDIWWGGVQSNGGLMLMLAYLLRTDIQWRSAQIYLKLVVQDATAAQAARLNLESLISSARIKAEPMVIIAGDRSFEEILYQSSASADLVFLGMARPDEPSNFQDYYKSLSQRAQNLPSTVFVLAAPDFTFAEVVGAPRKVNN